MTSATVRCNQLHRDKEIVETSVPAFMLVLMLEECQKKGILARPDVIRHLTNAVSAPLTKVDTLSVARLVKRIDEVATTLLNDLDPADPRHGLYSCAQFVLKLVDEFRLPDKTNQATLVSLLLMDDVKDDRPDANGLTPVWKVEEQKWRREADKILSRAMLMGLYAPSMQSAA